MKLTDSAEEILESLWVEIIEGGKDKCDISVLRDSEMIKELADSGYIKITDHQVSLSDKGKNEAKNCVRRHRLAERLLVDILDVKRGLVHKTSCKFEHLLRQGLDENVCTLLGHPKTCPHGRPIPEGSCCRDIKRKPKKIVMPLSELGTGKKAKVTYIETRNRSVLQRLLAMGILPETNITLIRKFPSYVFQSGRRQFAIDKELAGNVYVRLV